jgi:hypothetical protein
VPPARGTRWAAVGAHCELRRTRRRRYGDRRKPRGPVLAAREVLCGSSTDGRQSATPSLHPVDLHGARTWCPSPSRARSLVRGSELLGSKAERRLKRGIGGSRLCAGCACGRHFARGPWLRSTKCRGRGVSRSIGSRSCGTTTAPGALISATVAAAAAGPARIGAFRREKRASWQVGVESCAERLPMPVTVDTLRCRSRARRALRAPVSSGHDGGNQPRTSGTAAGPTGRAGRLRSCGGSAHDDAGSENGSTSRGAPTRAASTKADACRFGGARDLPRLPALAFPGVQTAPTRAAALRDAGAGTRAGAVGSGWSAGTRAPRAGSRRDAGESRCSHDPRRAGGCPHLTHGHGEQGSRGAAGCNGRSCEVRANGVTAWRASMAAAVTSLRSRRNRWSFAHPYPLSARRVRSVAPPGYAVAARDEVGAVGAFGAQAFVNPRVVS